MIRSTPLVVAVLVGVASWSTANAFCTGDCDGNHSVAFNELLDGVNISLGGAAVPSCENFDRNGDGRITVDELVTATRSALQGCVAQDQAFILTSDFTTGSFATVDLDPPYAVMPSSPHHLLYQDAAVRSYGGALYVINRLFADNIQVLDPARNFATRLQCSVGNSTNPHDIAFASSSKAYVTRFETAKLLIVNPSVQPNCADFTLGTIDLSSLADADGNPDMDQMVVVDGLLYVSLERLNINSILRTPAKNGAIAVIDTASDQLVGSIELTGKNPFSSTNGLTVRDGFLYVSEVGLFGVLDGGIERVDLATQRAEGFLVTEADLGGDIIDFVLVSEHLAYAIVNQSNSKSALLAFDPTTREITATLLEAAGYTFGAIEMNDRGELYLADRAVRAPGIRIFRVADGTQLTAAPLNLVLPPLEIVFIP